MRTSKPKSSRATPAKSTQAGAAKPARRGRKKSYQYEFCLSFAGENRKYVERVSKQLKARGHSVFYDTDNQVELWGANLEEKLIDLYCNRALFCVVFFSEDYMRKRWTKVELKSALERANDQKEAYILTHCLDDKRLPPALNKLGHSGLNGKPPRDLVTMLRKKLALEQAKQNPAKAPSKKPATRAKTRQPVGVAAAGAFSYRGTIKDSGQWMLLDGEFYLTKSHRKIDGIIHVSIAARDADEEARLEILDPKSGARYNPHGLLHYAFRNGAFDVEVASVQSELVGKSVVYTLQLRPRIGQTGHSGMGSWADEAAEKQARLLLLNEKSERGLYGNISPSGFGVAASQAVFPALWQRLQGRKMAAGDVLRCARLEAVAQLIRSGTVETVTRLELGSAIKGILKVDFAGRRAASHHGAKGAQIKFSGDCDLTS